MARPLPTTAGGGKGPITAPPAPAKQGNYWLVRVTNQGRGSVWSLQNLPQGQRPLAAGWGAAVYLGSTVAQANKNIAAACKALGIPDIRNRPSLQDTIGIISGIFAGFAVTGAAGAAASSAEVAADATVAGGATAAETGAAAAGGSAISNAIKSGVSKVGSAVGSGAVKKAVGALAISSLLTQPGIWKGVALVIAGAVLVLLGILGLAGVDAGKVKSAAMGVV